MTGRWRGASRRQSADSAAASLAISGSHRCWRRLAITGSAFACRSRLLPALPRSLGSRLACWLLHLGEAAPVSRICILGFVLLLGIGVFLFAMRWDSSDPTRTTRRSDVAFWLHLLAAPMIVHPIFTLLGLNDGYGDDQRRLDRRCALCRDGPDGLGDRSSGPARLGTGLCALRAERAVQAIWRGRAQRCPDGPGDRLGLAHAVGLLAPGPVADRRSASGRPSRPAAVSGQRTSASPAPAA